MSDVTEGHTSASDVGLVSPEHPNMAPSYGTLMAKPTLIWPHLRLGRRVGLAGAHRLREPLGIAARGQGATPRRANGRSHLPSSGMGVRDERDGGAG
eukprot:1872783-Prymnesium_polylepis.1